MRRRALLAVVSGAALWPQLAGAQQPRLMGILMQDTAEMARADDDALRRGLAEGGFAEGTVAFAERYAETDLTRLPVLASDWPPSSRM